MLIIYSQSRSFKDHISTVYEGDVDYRSVLSPPMAVPDNVYLIHAASFPGVLPSWLKSACNKGVVIGVATDVPVIEDMLLYTQMGVKAYFNGHMSAINYEQMLRMLMNGQSWFPPPLLNEVYDLARGAIQGQPNNDPLEPLTKREREVAIAVSEGMSNRRIADDLDISERTVKTHLTNIFKKLDLKDRVGLVIHLNQYDSSKLMHYS